MLEISSTVLRVQFTNCLDGYDSSNCKGFNWLFEQNVPINLYFVNCCHRLLGR